MSDKQGWTYNEVSGAIEEGDAIVACLTFSHLDRVGAEQYDADGRKMAAANELYAAVAYFLSPIEEFDSEVAFNLARAALLQARPEGGQK